MKIKSFLGGYDNNLSYLVWCDKTKIAAIIDPSVEINPMIELIETNKTNQIFNNPKNEYTKNLIQSVI